ncbi:unnamed protein product [Paramecium octaurelia]|uniref:EGF-like domain-containing protein n=1 Tax=Paramecium octaurelia TaxID=43137 RepID=A0A8S1U0M7_PAROT|nr:unnamed protein product [Paramecium octaurelia]
MSSVQKELDNSNCNGRGLYQEQTCQCDLGYFGVDCSQKLEELHVASYFTFIGLFLILFMLLLVFTVKQLQISLKTNKIPTYQRGLSYLKNFLGSPLNCILCLTLLFNVLKIVWLILDPFQPFDGDKRVFERILAEVVYTILFYIYGILLMVWYTMYDEISFNVIERNNNSKSQSVFKDELKIETRKWIFVYYKDIMKIRLFFVFLIQLTISTLNGNLIIQLGLRLSQQYKTILYIAYAILLLNFISFIFEFFLYGKLLNQCIESQLKKLDRDSKEKNIEEVEKNNEEQFAQGNQQQQIVFSKSSLGIQQDEQLQSPETQDQQVLRLSSQSGSEDNNEQVSTLRAIVSIEKLNLSNIKKSVSFKKQQNSMNELPDQPFKIKVVQSSYDLEPNKDAQKNHLKTIVSEESQSSKDEGAFHQKVNSCLLNEDDDTNQENGKWDIDKNRQNIRKIKNMQIKIVEKTKQQVIETKKFKKATLKINNRETLFDAQVSDERKTKVLSGEDYQQEIQAQQKQIRTANLNADKKVIVKIQILIYAGVFLEICFGSLSIVILLTDLLKTAAGTLCYLYISAMLQYLSLITVLKLFRDVRSQEVLNLIWIQKVGNGKNKINQKYFFTIPQQQTKIDDSKKKFEQRINMHIR